MTPFRILAIGALAIGVLGVGGWFYFERIANPRMLRELVEVRLDDASGAASAE